MTRKEAERLARQENTLFNLGFTLTEAAQLRRISMTLHRWHERECNGEVDRDESTGKVHAVNTYSGGKFPTADRETGALRRLKAIIAARNARQEWAYDGGKIVWPHSVSSYVQGDPRGAALYILRPGDVPAGEDAGAYYSRGVCVY